MGKKKNIYEIFKQYTAYSLSLMGGFICMVVHLEDPFKEMVVHTIGFAIALISLYSFFKYGEIIGKTLEKVVDKCGLELE